MSRSKKIFSKLFLTIIMTMLVFVVGGSTVNASFPSSLSTVSEGEFVGSYNIAFFHVKTSGNYKVFCTSGINVTSPAGRSCSLISPSQWTEGQQAGVAAIISEYNNGRISGVFNSYWYAEVAINSYLKPGSIGSAAESDSIVQGLVTKAKAAEKKANAEFSLTLSSSSLTFTESGNYYVSNKIKVTDANGYLDEFKVTVSGVDGVEVYNKTDNSFQVRFPSSKVGVGKTVTVTAKITGTKSYSVAQNYACGSNVQNVTIDYIEPKTKTSEISINGKVSKQSTKVEISKKDITTKKELPGATLVVKDANGKEIDKWVSTTEPHYISNLEPGKYTLTETIAPEGYKLTTEEIEFEVKSDGTTTKVVMYNEPNSVGVTVSKQDITTKEELPGATLVVKDANGKEIDKWVSTTEPHYIELEPGKYTLTETIAPEGYVLTTEEIEFEVKSDGTTTKVVMYNEPSKGVSISKQDITTKEELPGATLVVKDANGNEIERWVSTTEPHYIQLAPGEYTLTEITAPDGYDLSYEVVRFTVDSEGNATTEVVMYNSKTPDTADKNLLLVVVGIIGTGIIGAVAIKKLKHQM